MQFVINKYQVRVLSYLSLHYIIAEELIIYLEL